MCVCVCLCAAEDASPRRGDEHGDRAGAVWDGLVRACVLVQLYVCARICRSITKLALPDDVIRAHSAGGDGDGGGGGADGGGRYSATTVRHAFTPPS